MKWLTVSAALLFCCAATSDANAFFHHSYGCGCGCAHVVLLLRLRRAALRPPAAALRPRPAVGPGSGSCAQLLRSGSGPGSVVLARLRPRLLPAAALRPRACGCNAAPSCGCGCNAAPSCGCHHHYHHCHCHHHHNWFGGCGCGSQLRWLRFLLRWLRRRLRRQLPGLAPRPVRSRLWLRLLVESAGGAGRDKIPACPTCRAEVSAACWRQSTTLTADVGKREELSSAKRT